MSKKSEAIENKTQMEEELCRKLERNVEQYFEEAKRIIKGLEERRKVYKEFLTQIDSFIAYAKNQIENMDLSEGKRLKYLDLIEEEKSLHDRIKEDLERNDELIKSIKKSTHALFR